MMSQMAHGGAQKKDFCQCHWFFDVPPPFWTINVKAATVGAMQSVSSCADGHFEEFDHSAKDVEDVTGFSTALLFSPTFCICVTMQDQIGR